MNIQDLKNAITSQEELELVAKEIWFMHFTNLIKLGFSLDFATKQATRNAERQVNLLTK
jgi:hypothetical protein